MKKISYYIAKLIKNLILSAVKDSTIHATSRIASASHVVNIRLDRYSYIGSNCTVLDTKIGSFCSIADNTIIGGASHPIDWVSTSPIFCKGNNIMKKNFSEHKFEVRKETIIENDVWIGSNCLIKSGISISNGAIIGMGSVVTKNVGPYEIWAGNPAKLISKRFEDEIINNLISIKWWNFDNSKLNEYSPLMNSTLEFINQNNAKKDKS